MPPTGAVSFASAMALAQRGELRVDGVDPRLRRGDLLAPGAGAQPRDALRARRGARSFAACDPRRRHVAPRRPHRRAACASRRSTPAAPRTARRRRSRRAARTRRRRRRPAPIRPAPRAWRMSSGRAPACSSRSCAVGLRALRLDAAHGELGVGGIERAQSARRRRRGPLRRRRSRGPARRPPAPTRTSVAST